MAVTMKEIAKKVGVSRQTVSDVLNNKWKEKRIGEETMKKIHTTVQELNYHRNNIARSLVMKRTNILGLLIPCVTYSFWPKFARRVEDIARENGYHVLLCYTDGDWQREIEEINLLREHRAAGLIVAPAFDREDVNIFMELQNDEIPFVLVDQSLEGLECNFVGTDDRIGAYEAVTHLIKLGHTRIAHISGPQSSSTARGRLQGYREALADNKITLNDMLIEGNGFQEEDGRKATEKLLRLENRPTAIFAVTDMASMGAMQFIKKTELKVPEHIAIVGFADNESASIIKPALTTVRQPVTEMGEAAVRMLLKEIEGKKAGNNGAKDTQRIILKPTLVVRESCGADLKLQEDVGKC